MNAGWCPACLRLIGGRGRPVVVVVVVVVVNVVVVHVSAGCSHCCLVIIVMMCIPEMLSCTVVFGNPGCWSASDSGSSRDLQAADTVHSDQGAAGRTGSWGLPASLSHARSQ